MEHKENYFICKDYNRTQFDFNEIQRHKDNPKDSLGYPVYPIVLPHNVGSSYTYKMSEDLFFKRKQQDGNGLAQDTILSLHHYNKNYHELHGSLDDVSEVICYILAKNMINPKTGEPLVKVAEYGLATYTDKEDILLRGCVSKNICPDENTKLISMADILKATNMTGNSINVYIAAIEKYCSKSKCSIDVEKIRHDLIKNSYFCWKVANSDNHKNNITFFYTKQPDGTFTLEVSPMIDNGSAYELSSPYYLSGTTKPRFEAILEDEKFSTINDEGEREFAFPYYPHMHNAFYLNTDELIFTDTKLTEKSFGYEYCLAAEMLTNPELFFEIAEIEKQFDLNAMEDEIDKLYGSPAYDNKINWPPLLKEYMKETNDVKSRTLAFVVADYYLYTAYSSCVEKVDRNNAPSLYNIFRDAMLTLPLLPSKESYDELFVKLCKDHRLDIDKNKLDNLQFKRMVGPTKPENQPN